MGESGSLLVKTSAGVYVSASNAEVDKVTVNAVVSPEATEPLTGLTVTQAESGLTDQVNVLSPQLYTCNVNVVSAPTSTLFKLTDSGEKLMLGMD